MTQNKIWIELDNVATKTEKQKQCELANKMLARLGITQDEFFILDSKRGSVYCYGGNHGYTELADRGKWFNLDYLANGDL